MQGGAIHIKIVVHVWAAHVRVVSRGSTAHRGSKGVGGAAGKRGREAAVEATG